MIKDKNIINTYEKGKKKYYVNKIILLVICPPLAVFLGSLSTELSFFEKIAYLFAFYLFLGMIFMTNIPKQWKEIERKYNVIKKESSS